MKWYHYVVVGLIMVGAGCSQNPKPQTLETLESVCKAGCGDNVPILKATIYGDGGTDITVFSGGCPPLIPAILLAYLKDLDKYLPEPPKDPTLGVASYDDLIVHMYSTRGNQLRADAARLDQEDKAVSDYRFILWCIQHEAQK